MNDYLDDTADPELKSHLHKHVNECPNCWVIVDTTKKTLQVFKGAEPQVIPPDVHDRLMKALEKKVAASKRAVSSPNPPPA